MTLNILFDVIRARGWAIEVEEDWDIDPTLVAIANRRNKSICVNGSKAPSLQAIAVTAIVRCGCGIFYPFEEYHYPTFHDKSVDDLRDSDWGQIKEYWDEIETVLTAVAAQQKVR